MGKNFKQVLVLVLTIMTLLCFMIPMTVNAATGMSFKLDVYDADGNKYPTGQYPEVEFIIKNENGDIVTTFKTDRNGNATGITGLTDGAGYYLDVSDGTVSKGQFFYFEDTSWDTQGKLLSHYEQNQKNGNPGLEFMAFDGMFINDLMTIKTNVVEISELSMPVSFEKVQLGNDNIKIGNTDFSLYKYLGNKDIFADDTVVTLRNNGIYINNAKVSSDDLMFIKDFTTDVATGLYEGLDIPCGTYLLFETKANADYFENKTAEGYSVATPIILSEYNIAGQHIVIRNEARGSIEVTKVDSHGNPLADVVFDLQIAEYDESLQKFVFNDFLTGLRTDANGYLLINDLHYGSYQIVERQRDGWRQVEPIQIDIKGDSNITTKHKLQVVNKPLKLTATKYDKSNTPLSDVTFELYYIAEGGTRVLQGTYTTGSDGKICDIANINAGNYVLVETNCPSGYMLDSVSVTDGYSATLSGREISFTITDDANKNDLHIDIFNKKVEPNQANVTKYGQVINGTVSTYDEETGEHVYTFTTQNGFLAGATFELTAVTDIYKGYDILYSAGDVVTTIVTTGNEFEVIDNLYPGTYKLTEKTPPVGYEISTAETIIVITDDDETVAIENTLKKITFNILKKDETSNEAIEGAIFGIFATEDIYYNGNFVLAKDSCIALLTTDRNGFATSGEIYAPMGLYSAREIRAADGYVINTIPQTKRYEGTEQELSFEFTNERQLYSIVVVKTGDVLNDEALMNGTIEWTVGRLSGVEFTLYAAKDIVTPDATHTVVYKAGDEILKKYTDNSGTLLFDNLLPGEYIIKETKTKSGYAIDENNERPVSIKNSNVEETFYNARYITNITVNKTDGNNPLSGAKFGIYNNADIKDASGNVKIPANTCIYEFISNAEGIAELKNVKLPIGTYTVKEISAPEGYKKDNGTFDVDAESANPVNNVYAYEFNSINTPYVLVIHKVDEVDNSYVTGAKLALYKDGAEYATFEVTNDAWVLSATNGTPITPGKYTLKELSAPIGYELAQDKEFVIGENDIYTEQTMVNTRTTGTINITKLEDSTNRPIENVKFVLKANGEIVAEGITNSNGKLQFTNVVLGTYLNGALTDTTEYTLEEVEAPNYYVKNYSETFRLIDLQNKPEKVEKNVVVYNVFTTLTINKFDEDGTTPLTGAHFQLIDKNGQVVAEWTEDGKSVYTKTHLAFGEYKLIETLCPEGYKVRPEDKDGFTVIISENEPNAVINVTNLVDDYTITVNKVDSNNEYLPGAQFELRDSQGKVVISWTSENAPKVIDGVKPGTYTIVEVTAPAGYVTAEPVSVVLEKGGITKDTEFTVTNEKIIVKIHKVEKGDETKHIANAKLHLEDENGNIIYSWTTPTDGAHVVDMVIPAGKYYIVEDEAPDEYLINNTKVLIEVKEVATEQEFFFENDYTKVEISKYIEGTEDFLVGAQLHLEDKDGNIVARWTSENKAFTITHLVPGEYTLVEDVTIDGYVLAEPITFTVPESGDVLSITMYNNYTKLDVYKYIEGTTDFLVGAKLHLEDKNGNVVAEWTTNDKEYRITGLIAGEYLLVEDEAPKGYVVSDPIKVIIAPNVEYTTATMYNNYIKLDISKYVDGTTELLSGAKLQLKDKDGNVVAEWTTTDKEHRITHLATGEYTLIEVEAPDGYIIADPVTITITGTQEFVEAKMYNKYTKLDVYKYIADTTTFLPGVKLHLEDADGNVITSWTTGEEAHQITHLKAGQYFVVEDEAPDGYILANRVSVIITGNEEYTTATMYNKCIKLDVYKYIENSTDFLAGAKLHLEDKDGNIVAEWTTNDKEYRITGLKPGEYFLVEDEAPNGYIVSAPIKVIITGEEEFVKATMYNKYIKLNVFKYIEGTTEFLAGAHLHLEDKDGNIVAEWISGDKEFNITRLPVGEYKLVEDKAPNGYVVSEPVTIIITGTNEVVEATMYNNYIKLDIYKYIEGTTEFLAGAKLHLEDKDGNIIDSWTSGDTAHRITHLLTGEYWLVEDEAPAGYVKSAPIKIVINGNEEFVETKLYNNYIKLDVYKYIENSTNFLAGAKLQLKDKNGTVVAEWTTEDKAYRITHLTAGEYTLVEVSAPNGYVVAEPITIIITGEEEFVEAKMYDKYIKLDIYKYIADTTTFLPGVKLHLEDMDGNIIDEWTTNDTTHRITHLLTGEYLLVEDETIDGYIVSEPIKIVITGEEEYVTAIMYNKYTKLNVFKYIHGTTEFLAGAKLHLEDMDGNIVAEWVTSDKEHVITHLLTGEYLLVEDAAPNGYVIAEPIKVVISAENNEVSVEMFNQYTNVEIYKYIDGTTTFLPGAKLHIEDENGNTIVEWVSTDAVYTVSGLKPGNYFLVEDAAPAGYKHAQPVAFTVTGDGTTVEVVMYDAVEGTDPINPPTGDTTNIWLHITLMMLSLIGIVSLVIFKKKSKI